MAAACLNDCKWEEEKSLDERHGDFITAKSDLRKVYFFFNNFIKIVLNLTTVGLITQTFLPVLCRQVLTACWNKGGSVQKHNTA